MVSKAEIGKRIRKAIDSAGLTQRAVGEAIGVGEGAMSSYISGRTEPSGKGYAAIATACGVSLDWLIKGEGEMQAGGIYTMQGNHDLAREHAPKYGPLRTAVEDELEKLSDVELSELLTQLLKKAREEKD